MKIKAITLFLMLLLKQGYASLQKDIQDLGLTEEEQIWIIHASSEPLNEDALSNIADENLNPIETVPVAIAVPVGQTQESLVDAMKNLELSEEEMRLNFGAAVIDPPPVSVPQPEPAKPVLEPKVYLHQKFQFEPSEIDAINQVNGIVLNATMDSDVHTFNQIPGDIQLRIFNCAARLTGLIPLPPSSMDIIQQQLKVVAEGIKTAQREIRPGQMLFSPEAMPNLEGTAAHLNAYFVTNERAGTEIVLPDKDLLLTSYRLALFVRIFLRDYYEHVRTIDPYVSEKNQYDEDFQNFFLTSLFQNEMTGGGCKQGYLGRLFRDMFIRLRDMKEIMG